MVVSTFAEMQLARDILFEKKNSEKEKGLLCRLATSQLWRRKFELSCILLLWKLLLVS